MGAAAAGFLFMAVGVVVIIRNKEGEKVAELNVPEGGSVEVKGESAAGNVGKVNVPAGGSVEVKNEPTAGNTGKVNVPAVPKGNDVTSSKPVSPPAPPKTLPASEPTAVVTVPTPQAAAVIGPDGAPSPAIAPFDAKQARAHQDAWAKRLGTTVETTNSVGGKMVLIPQGEFMMGSTDEQVEAALIAAAGAESKVKDRVRDAERPRHGVKLTRPFFMGTTEVTVGQFKKFVEATGYVTYLENPANNKAAAATWRSPGFALSDDLAAANLSYDDVVSFCIWLSAQEKLDKPYEGSAGMWRSLPGNGYHIPTEAQWEYACRAGTTTQYSFGDQDPELAQHGWFATNSGGRVQVVGQKAANPFGLFDMHGNACEWCQDHFDLKVYANALPEDPVGPATGSQRVIRGGAWDFQSVGCRSAFRGRVYRDTDCAGNGFRIVRTLDASPVATPLVSVPSVPASIPTPTTTPATLPATGDPERRAAAWAYPLGAKMQLSIGGQPAGLIRGKLPTEPFVVRVIDFAENLNGNESRRTITDADIANVAGLKAIVSLRIPYSQVGDAGAKYLSTLTTLTTLDLTDTKITDAGLLQLATLTNLNTVYLSGTQITGAGLEVVKNWANLGENLRLDNTQVSDAGLVHLQSPKLLRAIDLSGTKVTDAGLAFLQTPSRLRLLKLNQTGITAAGVARLKAARPDLMIQWDSTATPATTTATPPLAVAPFDAKQARAHQDAWAKHLGMRVETNNSVGMKLALIPPGEFLMGSSDAQIEAAMKMGTEENVPKGPLSRVNLERTQHRVTITKPFLMGATEITIGHYKQFVTATNYVTELEKEIAQKGAGPAPIWSAPGAYSADDSAVARLTWNDACAFCNWLSEKEGLKPHYQSDGKGSWIGTAGDFGYHLPTEAQWEYACRAGTTTQFWFGDDWAQLEQYDWCNKNHRGNPKDLVGLKPANPFGLHDVHANMYEWCEDWYADYAAGAVTDPRGPAQGVNRVIRGSTCLSHATLCRSASRVSATPTTCTNVNGFRVVLGFDAVPTAFASATPAATVTAPAAPAAIVAIPVAKRPSVPDSTACEAALQLLKEIFKDDYAKGTKPDDKVAFAEKLLQQAEQSADDAAGRYVMLSEARRFAIDAGDTKALERTVVALARDYDVDELNELTDSWTDLMRKSRPMAVNKTVAEAALAKVEQAVIDEDFELAARLIKLAADAARKSKDSGLVKQVTDREKSMAAEKQQLDEADKATVVVAKSPDDPAANLALGKYLCFVKEEWEQGFAHLAKGNDPVLAELAKQSLTNPTGADAQAALGETWWKAAEAAKGAGKADLQAGSRYWYTKATPQLVGLAKTKAEQRLQTLGSTVTKPSKIAPPIAKAPFNAKQARAIQTAWGKQLRSPIAFKSRTGIPLVLIPPGEFLMGSSDEQIAAAVNVAEDKATKDNIQKAERPQHRVTLTKPIAMGATEVTIGQFKKFAVATGYKTEAEKAAQDADAQTYLNPGYSVTDDFPASVITWADAVAYCKWLSDMEKATYRLPTEAEWEYACRAGTTTQYSFGDDINQLEQFSWCTTNSGGTAHPVGTKPANAFGLHDMHGNMWEWCHDFYEEKWYEKTPSNDPTGPASGSYHVNRGGAWYYLASRCRSASRYSDSNTRHNYFGFRCVREW